MPPLLACSVSTIVSARKRCPEGGVGAVDVARPSAAAPASAQGEGLALAKAGSAGREDDRVAAPVAGRQDVTSKSDQGQLQGRNVKYVVL